MPCTITDVLVYRSSAGSGVALPNQQIFAIPATPNMRVDYAGTYRPLIGVNPQIVSSSLKYGAVATTDASGQWSLVLPYGASETKPVNQPWTILFPDGSPLTGVVPSTAGPLTVDDLISTYAWTWASQVYVAPVTPGTLVRGTASFSAATTATVLFSTAFASTAYKISLSPSLDTVTSNAPAVAWSSKSTTGFTINTSGSFTGSVDWEAVL